jgi:hypothetical protein
MQVFQTQIGGLEDAFTIARLQAEVAGLQFLGALVPTLTADLEIEIQSLLEIDREADNNGRRTDFDDAGAGAP